MAPRVPAAISRLEPLEASGSVNGVPLDWRLKYLLNLFRLHVDRMDLHSLVPGFKHGGLTQGLVHFAFVVRENALFESPLLVGLNPLYFSQLLLEPFFVVLLAL